MLPGTVRRPCGGSLSTHLGRPRYAKSLRRLCPAPWWTTSLLNLFTVQPNDVLAQHYAAGASPRSGVSNTRTFAPQRCLLCPEKESFNVFAIRDLGHSQLACINSIQVALCSVCLGIICRGRKREFCWFLTRNRREYIRVGESQGSGNSRTALCPAKVLRFHLLGKKLAVLFVVVAKVRATLVLESTEFLGPVGLQLFFLLRGPIEHLLDSWKLLCTTKILVPMRSRNFIAVVVEQATAGRREVIRTTQCNNMLLPGDLVTEILINFIIEIANLVFIQSICVLEGDVQS